jgi:hypothetical protein
MSLFDVLASSIPRGKNLFNDWLAKGLTKETGRHEPGDYPQIATHYTYSYQIPRPLEWRMLLVPTDRHFEVLAPATYVLFKRKVS